MKAVIRLFLFLLITLFASLGVGRTMPNADQERDVRALSVIRDYLEKGDFDQKSISQISGITFSPYEKVYTEKDFGPFLSLPDKRIWVATETQGPWKLNCEVGLPRSLAMKSNLVETQFKPVPKFSLQLITGSIGPKSLIFDQVFASGNWKKVVLEGPHNQSSIVFYLPRENYGILVQPSSMPCVGISISVSKEIKEIYSVQKRGN